MCSGSPARVHPLKHMVQHNPSSFNFNKFRVLNIVCNPPNSCLKTDQYPIFFNFQTSKKYALVQPNLL